MSGKIYHVKYVNADGEETVTKCFVFNVENLIQALFKGTIQHLEITKITNEKHF